MPLAVWAWWRHRESWRLPGTAFALLAALQVVAFVFAGLWYVGETAIQTSLWRFSPHAKLLAVAMAATWIFNESRRSQLLAAAVLVVSLCSLIIYRGDLEIPMQPRSGQRILDAADWARHHSETDALFLVPPGVGSAFPIHARRGHVVSFKLVPQLAGEIGPWSRRLGEVVGSDDIAEYGGGFTGYESARRAMDDDYHARPVDDLAAVARRHGASYVVKLRDAEKAQSPIVWSVEGVTIYKVD